MSSIKQGSLWHPRKMVGLHVLHYDEKTSIYVQDRAGCDNIIDLHATDLVQFIQYRYTKVRNSVMNMTINEHVISLLHVEKMKKCNISIRMSNQYWEA